MRTAKVSKATIDGTIAELAQLRYPKGKMVIRNYDGPAGQIEEMDTDTIRKHPSQPSIEADRRFTVGDETHRAYSGLNQKALGGAVGHEQPMSSTPAVRSASQKSGYGRPTKEYSGTRKPLYLLRTVTPTSPTLLRPSAQHIPGSYISEIDARGNSESIAAMQTHDDTSLPPDGSPQNTDSSHSPTVEPPRLAMDVGVKASERNSERDGSTFVLALQAPLRGKRSRSTMESSPSTKSAGHFLLKPTAEYMGARQPIDPVLTTSPEYESLFSKEGLGSEHVLDARSARSLPASTIVMSKEEEVPKSIPDHSSMDHFGNGPLSNTQVHGLYADTPPFTNETNDDLRTLKATEKLERGTQQSPLTQQPPSFDSIPTSEPSRAQPRSDWVRHFLEKRPSASATHEHSILNVRPVRGQGAAISKSASTNSAETIHVQRKPDSITVSASQYGQTGSEATDLVSIAREQQMKTEAISKTILDLESLLREALLIANEAADKDKDTGSRNYHGAVKHHAESNGRSLWVSPGANNEGDEHPQKEDDFKNHVISVEPEYLPSHQNAVEKSRDAIPYPASSVTQTRHTSLAPTGIPVQFSSDLAKAMATWSSSSESDADLNEHGLVTSWSPLESSLRGPQSLPDSARSINASRELAKATEIKDWALASRRVSRYPEEYELLSVPRQSPQRPATSQLSTKESHIHLLREHKPSSNALSRDVVRDFIDAHHAPPVQPRISSVRLRSHTMHQQQSYDFDRGYPYLSDEDSEGDVYVPDFRNDGVGNRAVNREWAGGEPRNQPGLGPGSLPHHDTITSLRGPPAMDRNLTQQPEGSGRPQYSLRGRHHFSIRGSQGFSLSRSHPRAPIARDWSIQRKRHAATVACISTALLGLIIGIYAGEVPAIQYTLADEHHFTILGNVVFFVGLAIPTLLFWPLPLLHGRKPYTLAALTILLPLQFPQAVIVGAARSPYDVTYRAGLLISRAFAGFVMGFANINFQTTLLDLFGSSLQSGNPHQEIVNENDVRRHGGGMGVWLGIWTWCFIGSLGIGFLIGAVIVSGLDVQWGFWITIILTAVVLFLNVLTPEVRRSPYRRSMAEVQSGTDISRRIARGEIKMHLDATGPKHWWEEVSAGHRLVIKMLKQPGFIVLSLYMAWIYSQVVLLIIVSRSMDSSSLHANLVLATWCPDIAILSVPSAVCWSLCHGNPNWRTAGYSFSESVLF